MSRPSDDVHDVQITLILASGSPRRHKLLALLGVPFWVMPADVEEANQAGEGPAEMALRLSQSKARSISSRVGDSLVVGADTLVCLEGEILGKPANAAGASEMLRRLRGKPHEVHSGVTLITAPGAECCISVTTTVRMRDYTDREIAAYVARGDPLDKAGAYAIQHQELNLVARVDGCYANVMGLPLCHLYRTLREAGFDGYQRPVTACDDLNQRTCRVAAELLREVCP
jgi:septum formation protein